MSTFLDELRRRGVPGVHLGAWGENASGIRFFRAVGFELVGQRVPSPGFRLRDGGRATVVHLTRTV